MLLERMEQEPPEPRPQQHDPHEPDLDEAPLPEGRWSSSRLVPLAIIIGAGAIIAVLLFSARSAQAAGLAALGAGTVQDGSLPVTLPIRYAAGQIVLDVRLGDDETIQPMLLDSGAPTAISESLAAVHGGDPAGTVSTISVDGRSSATR